MHGRDSVLITVQNLQRHLAAGASPAVLDVRWRLDRPDGWEDYLSGHIPGAMYVSLDDDLSDHTRPGRGRHPLPNGPAVQDAARRWGIRQDQPVVVYDDWNRAGSCRAWWVLTAAGLTDVRILDGGLSAWTAAGGDLQTGPVTAPRGDVTVAHDDLYSGANATVTAEQIAAGALPNLIDARAPERFRGEVEPMDPVAGHIPGAHNLPATAVLNADGTFLPESTILDLLGDAGVEHPRSLGVYCGSGVTASVVLAGLRVAGVDASLFPGSWSQWSADRRPAAQGPSGG